MTFELIQKAARLAVTAHAGQERKFTGQPYDVHLARVAGKVLVLDEATPDMVAAAWLHDMLEDTLITRQEIAQATNPYVAQLVFELTNQKVGGIDRRTQKQYDRERLQRVSREAQLIKCCDRLDNLQDIPLTPASAAFRQMYAQESVQLAEALMRAIPPHPAACAMLDTAMAMCRDTADPRA